jgi:HEPN domain-containing protein
MNKTITFLLMLSVLTACSNRGKQDKSVVVAQAGKKVLYYDEIPLQVREGLTADDSTTLIHNYINKWAKREIVFQKAEDNISPELRNEIEKQLDETRVNLVVYEYQQQMMLEKMDTVITDEELRNYYSANPNSFSLTANIVKALFIKLPVETPNIYRIKTLLRSNRQKDMQELESLCYQFAEKHDDFNEEWVTLDRISLELNKEITNQENFLKRNTYYESADSSSVCLLEINDYRLRGSLAPFEYIKDDIKRIIWNNRRMEFIQNLENGIYNDAVKDNGFKIF